MTEPNLEPGDLILEDFTPEHREPVSVLLGKFIGRLDEQPTNADELGLVFSTPQGLDTDPLVERIFEEHPELEEDRKAMDQRWWDNFSEKKKKDYEGDEEFLEERKKISRHRVVLASPFSAELHQAEVRHHLENTDAQHRAVVKGRDEVLGYLAVWCGASTLYLDDHMQVDIKVADPDLPVEDQRLVVSKFEPILYDLSLP